MGARAYFTVSARSQHRANLVVILDLGVFLHVVEHEALLVEYYTAGLVSQRRTTRGVPPIDVTVGISLGRGRCILSSLLYLLFVLFLMFRLFKVGVRSMALSTRGLALFELRKR